jgi:hypothetical protein
VTQPSREISATDAVQIAQDECGKQGIPWREPHSVKEKSDSWEVRTPSNVRGGNATILVSKATGVPKIRYYER